MLPFKHIGDVKFIKGILKQKNFSDGISFIMREKPDAVTYFGDKKQRRLDGILYMVKTTLLDTVPFTRTLESTTPFTGILETRRTKDYVCDNVFNLFSQNQASEKAQYINGRRHGDTIWFYENGTPKLFQTYIGGRLNGVATWLYENGDTRKESRYKNGYRHGFFLEWCKCGNLKKTQHYKNGVLMEQAQCPDIKVCGCLAK